MTLCQSYYSEINQYVINLLKCSNMKRVYDLSFTKDNRFVIYKGFAIFGFLFNKKRIETFSNIDDALKYFKQL
jgi:hypothetical protein